MGATFKHNFYEINDMFSTEKNMKRYFLKHKAIGVPVIVFQSVRRKLKRNVWQKSEEGWVIGRLGFLQLSLSFTLYYLYFIMRKLFFYLTVADLCHKLSWLLNKGPALASSNVKLLCCTLMKFYMLVQGTPHYGKGDALNCWISLKEIFAMTLATNTYKLPGMRRNYPWS